jgi:DNA-binding response OmpR family regulator
MKALIAEDDLYTRQALAAILESEGWETLACADGRNALAGFRPGEFGLVCLDIMMPQLSGYDVCREIRRLDTHVPILFISAKSEEIDTVLGLELGADDYIVKPFGVRELQARIRAVLRRSQPGPAEPPVSAASGDAGVTAIPPFAFGPWEVRPAELRAHSGGRCVDLLAREIRLLACLAAHPGQAITREEFFRQCWRLEQAPLSRTLDQHIARLRKKIEPANAPPLIQTVQGVGYRYQAPSP